MKDYSRTDRIAQVMQQELAQMIQREVKDPRMPEFVTVAAVAVSKDLAYAKVYITTLKPEDQQITMDILQHAAGFLRSQLSKRIKLRITPQLHFIYDTSVEYGNRLSNLIDQAAKEIPPNDDSSSDR
ncbi:MAG: 30S ribosome-binding factor RbfA [Legionellales bacterium]|nr:30S ribosome-binding factor RbfA [Legionellales bacterium]